MIEKMPSRLFSAVFAAVCAVTLSACAPSYSGSAESASTKEQSTSSASREASLFYQDLEMCILNSTQEPLDLVFVTSALGGPKNLRITDQDFTIQPSESFCAQTNPFNPEAPWIAVRIGGANYAGFGLSSSPTAFNFKIDDYGKVELNFDTPQTLTWKQPGATLDSVVTVTLSPERDGLYPMTLDIQELNLS
ncbi:hypothetical protein [uncultured Aurantimicrobium sp.]|uniref:hypothetical protein n=1 Tax=uncultured Aurantimicrobium sp. TaxID=1705357 RepID=UPI0026188AD2|nr:hypothetical protein [uncultured Aurantimicrobium sp.]